MLNPTAIFIVEVPAPEAAIVAGFNVAVVPEGTPETERLMGLLKPPLSVVVMVAFP